MEITFKCHVTSLALSHHCSSTGLVYATGMSGEPQWAKMTEIPLCLIQQDCGAGLFSAHRVRWIALLKETISIQNDWELELEHKGLN